MLRPFIKKDEKNIEEEEFYSNISIKDYNEKVDIKFEDLISIDVENVKPGKKWSITITLDFGKFLDTPGRSFN